MKVAIKDLINSSAAMQKVYDCTAFKIQLSMKLAKNIKLITECNQEFEKRRIELIKKLGEEVKGQEGSYNVKPENAKEFNDAMRKMQDEEVDLDLYQLTYDEVPEKLQGEISPQDLYVLEWFFIEKRESPVKAVK